MIGGVAITLEPVGCSYFMPIYVGLGLRVSLFRLIWTIRNGILVYTGATTKAAFKNMLQLPGFVQIPPGGYLSFPITGDDGKVWVSVTSGVRVIADNYPVVNDYSIIVDSNGYVHQAQYGKIWVDVSGVDHSITIGMLCSRPQSHSADNGILISSWGDFFAQRIV